MDECLQKGAVLVQSIADALFNLPSTEDREGPLVKLPPPTTRMPREKHVSLCLFLYVIPHMLFILLILLCRMKTVMHMPCARVLDSWKMFCFAEF